MGVPPMPTNIEMLRHLLFQLLLSIAFVAIATNTALAAHFSEPIDNWKTQLDRQLVDYYLDAPATREANSLAVSPEAAIADWRDPAAKQIVTSAATTGPLPLVAGRLRARMQQGIVVEMAAAIRAGDVERAKSLRAELILSRGVSASEGALLLQSFTGDKKDDAAKLLAREAITWQTSRARQLLDEAARCTESLPAMPGRLLERLSEANSLADLPAALRESAGLNLAVRTPTPDADLIALARKGASEWTSVSSRTVALQKTIATSLPSLLSDKERARRERLLLKLVQIVPKEYQAGIRDRQIVVPLEYREAVSFTQQARQIVGELAPMWLADDKRSLADPLNTLEQKLEAADHLVASKVDRGQITSAFSDLDDLLQSKFGINLRRSGTTADIVEEVMLETRTTLSSSLAQALAGNWSEAERLRVEAYTTYDPELEARLMPRDPQLATDIERLLLDGVGDKAGVKEQLDRRASADELTASYNNVYAALEKATVLLKSGISPTAAAMNAGSIVLREGLEGLLVIVAILAGLRGTENAHRRRLFWLGIVASLAATGVTWILSQTIITSLRAYGEVIAAITGLLAIGILLLITNWLFHQVYWKQWVTALKSQTAEGNGMWALITAGFLVGYREGFETVLFLQSLILDAGGQSVSIGVAVGCISLFLLGLAALQLGLKLPYFKILLITAMLIGIVLITFVGGTVRGMQTVGWLPVHRLTPGSWPIWMGSWFGFYNTIESVGLQALTVLTVVGTWRWARFAAKRKAEARRKVGVVRLQQVPPKVMQPACVVLHDAGMPLTNCDPVDCALGEPCSEHPTQHLFSTEATTAPLVPEVTHLNGDIPAPSRPSSLHIPNFHPTRA